MANKDKYIGHVLGVPYPAQGHINPMLQLCKRLSTTKPIKTTLATTTFISNNFKAQPGTAVAIDTFSDGFDDGGFSAADSLPSYIATMEAAGSRSLSELIHRHAASGHPITCVVYDSFMPWVPTVAKQHGLTVVAFFTQACTLNYIFYLLQRGLWKLEDIKYPVAVPGLEVELEMEDMPSFIGVSTYFQLALKQSAYLHLADFVLVNTFYELEPQVINSLSKLISPLLPIGPTIPSFYLDREDTDGRDYGLPLFNSNSSTNSQAMDWLKTKSPGSVIYVAFGSLTCFEKEQVEELVWALKASDYDFLWALTATEQPKLPTGVVEEMSKGLLTEWCSQLQVLANDAIGCFVTHCGWNSTQEALALGVPMVGIPQWADQTTNSKLMQDVWKTGIKAKADRNGIVRKEVIGDCIRQVMQGEKALELRGNARKWRDIAKQAVAHGGSSDKNIDVFLSKFAG